MSAASTTFDETIPEASQNRVAMALGKYLQGGLARVGLYALCTGAAGLGAAALAGEAVPQGPALLAAGILSTLLSWIVQNSPYDMLEALRATIGSMQTVGRELSAGVSGLEAENRELHSTREQMQEEIEEAAMVRRGMQQTLNTLLADIGNRHSELHKLTAEVASEVAALDEASDRMTNRFLSTITGLDTHVKRSEQLAKELNTSTRANAALGARMLEITGKLEESLDELQDQQFTDRLQDVAVQLDGLGDNGLRERLEQRRPLDEAQSAALLALLVALDATLRDELEAKRARCAGITASSRACISRSLSRAAESTV